MLIFTIVFIYHNYSILKPFQVTILYQLFSIDALFLTWYTLSGRVVTSLFPKEEIYFDIFFLRKQNELSIYLFICRGQLLVIERS